MLAMDFIKQVASNSKNQVFKTILDSNKSINEISINPGKIVQDSIKDARFSYNKVKATDMNDTYLKRAGITTNNGKYYNSKGEEVNIDKDGYMNNLSLDNRFRMSYLNNDGSLDKSRIATHVAGLGAAGYVGLSSVGRLASGGGLYRDSDGNFDIIGLPII